MNLTNEMKGSGRLENEIVTQVASYGSQLGTIIDFLESLDKRLDGTGPLSDEENYQRQKLKHLAEDIKRAKSSHTIDV